MGFFKAYDMRGTFGRDFDLALVRKIGAALPGVLGARRFLVGRDARSTGPAVAAALSRGLASAGASVTDIGLCSTPMVYFFTAEDGFDASVMVTASHNPAGDNGLKVSAAGARPVGYADGLGRVEAAVAAMPAAAPAADGDADAALPASPQPSAPSPEHLERYIAWQRHATPLDTPECRALRYAVDCSCGAAGIFAAELFPGAVILNAVPDGRFPAHSPNPLLSEARKQIAERVVRDGLDFGIVFDGDADRAIFVDERGRFVQPDYLIPFIARASAHPGDTVIHDVRTSLGAIETLREDGFEPLMVPVGHVFAKKALRERGASCGGELAGHYYFKEFHNCDSGVLAARRIVAQAAAAKERGNTFSQMVAPVSSRYANSGELNFRVEDKDAATARALAAAAKAFGREMSRSEIDGIRLGYGDGWFSVRRSNTEPFLRLVAEFRSRSRLDYTVQLLSEAIENGR